MITEDQYLEAKKIVEMYERQLHEFTEDDEEESDEPEPCSICGEINGTINPCCPAYDHLHFKNCGYG